MLRSSPKESVSSPIPFLFSFLSSTSSLSLKYSSSSSSQIFSLSFLRSFLCLFSDLFSVSSSFHLLFLASFSFLPSILFLSVSLKKISVVFSHHHHHSFGIIIYVLLSLVLFPPFFPQFFLSSFLLFLICSFFSFSSVRSCFPFPSFVGEKSSHRSFQKKFFLEERIVSMRASPFLIHSVNFHLVSLLLSLSLSCFFPFFLLSFPSVTFIPSPILNWNCNHFLPFCPSFFFSLLSSFSSFLSFFSFFLFPTFSFFLSFLLSFFS